LKNSKNMKKIISTIAFLILIVSCSVTKKAFQTEGQNAIRNDFTSYLSFMSNEEFNKAFDYFIHELFDVVPKEELVELMEEQFNTPGVEMSLEKDKILEVEKIKKVEGEFYSKLKYSLLVKMKIEMVKEKNETEKAKEKRINMAKLILQRELDAETVVYNYETDFFEIFVEEDVLAISENGQSNWKFLIIEEDNNEIIKAIIPEKVLKVE